MVQAIPSIKLHMNKKTITNFLSLFASSSTLICCALPALFVILGAGATIASITTLFPQLIWLSIHKLKLFLIAGVLIIISIYFEYKNKTVTCESPLEDTCSNTRSNSKIILIISCIIYFIGIIITYVFPMLYSM